jgi:hypothetical protein
VKLLKGKNMRVEFVYKDCNEGEREREIYEIWVKVHFFKQSGKWYHSEEIRWYENGLAHESLLFSIKQAHLGYEGMMAICLDNPRGYPLMIKEVKYEEERLKKSIEREKIKG